MMILKVLVLLAFILAFPPAVVGAEGAPKTAVPPSEAPAPAAAPRQDGIMLHFRDASLDAVLDYLSDAAGFVVVKDAAVTGRVSVVSRQPLNPEEAVDLLNTVLKDKGYAAVRMGRTLKIVALTDVKKANVPVRAGNNPEAVTPSDRVVTQVIPLRSVDAVRLKADIAPLIPAYADLTANASSNSLIMTDTEANIRRVMEIVRALDSHLAAVMDVKVFQLKYASAGSAARLINEIFKEDTAVQQQQRTGFLGPGRFFRGPGGDSQQNPEEGRKGDKVTASADDRTNTVVVSGPPDVLRVVESVVHQLDSDPTAEQAVMTYSLKNAKATNLETVLNKLFADRTSATAGASGTRTTSTRTTTGRTAAGATTAGQAGAAQVSPAAAAAAADLAGQVYVVADADTNSLMVMTPSKNFEKVRQIIADLDRAIPQVLIKVLIAEVTHTNKSDLGAEFSILNLRSSGRGPSVFTDFDVLGKTDGLVFKLLEKDVTAAIRAIQEFGKLDVLSRPYILASDNQAANITVGSRVPIPDSTRVTESGTSFGSFHYEDIGIILTVTPHINPDGLVILDVTPEISALTGETVPISETFSAVVIAKRSAKSRVAIQDGQTIVIGGLMEDKKTDTIRKVPLLGDIPLLGMLFRRTIKDTTKTELLVFLTPHVAKESVALQEMSDDELKGAKVTPGAVKPGTFQEHMEGMKRGAAKPNAPPGAK